MKNLLIYLFTLSAVIAQAQQPAQECSTFNLDSTAVVNQPWFGNNKYLVDKKEKKRESKKAEKRPISQDLF